MIRNSDGSLNIAELARAVFVEMGGPSDYDRYSFYDHLRRVLRQRNIFLDHSQFVRHREEVSKVLQQIINKPPKYLILAAKEKNIETVA